MARGPRTPIERWCLRAAADGLLTVHKPGSVTIRWAGNCSQPYTSHWVGESALDWRYLLRIRHMHHPQYDCTVKSNRGKRASDLYCTVEHRCGRCHECLRYKARQWAERTAFEVGRSARTWFVTLTFDDPWLFYWQAKADTEKVAFFEATGEEITKMMKRIRWRKLRKPLPLYGPIRPGQKWRKLHRVERAVRFIAVAEYGEKTGRPHWHLMIHEVSKDARIPSRELDHNATDAVYTAETALWKYGNVYPRLVDEDKSAWEAAWYVCKYISKAPVARVRASLRYGRPKGEAGADAPGVYPSPKDHRLASEPPAARLLPVASEATVETLTDLEEIPF